MHLGILCHSLFKNICYNSLLSNSGGDGVLNLALCTSISLCTLTGVYYILIRLDSAFPNLEEIPERAEIALSIYLSGRWNQITSVKYC